MLTAQLGANVSGQSSGREAGEKPGQVLAGGAARTREDYQACNEVISVRLSSFGARCRGGVQRYITSGTPCLCI